MSVICQKLHIQRQWKRKRLPRFQNQILRRLLASWISSQRNSVVSIKTVNHWPQVDMNPVNQRPTTGRPGRHQRKHHAKSSSISKLLTNLLREVRTHWVNLQWSPHSESLDIRLRNAQHKNVQLEMLKGNNRWREKCSGTQEVPSPKRGTGNSLKFLSQE